MGLKIEFDKKASKDLEKLDKSIKQEIKKKLIEFKKNPLKGKHLKHCDFWSLRVNDYRLIYRLTNNKIQILYVAHRKDVYTNFSKLF